MSVPITKSLDDIRLQLFERIEYAQEKGWLPKIINLERGPARGLIELWAWGLWQLYQFLATMLNQAFPSESSGEWLDLHCEQVGIERYPATKTEGHVVFIRNTTEGNVNIPSGRIVKTKPDGTGAVYRYVTTEDLVLTSGNDRISVPVLAESVGAAYNVVTGMICEITTVIPGIDEVANISGWITSEGRDEETDQQLFERYVLAWESLNGVTKRAYESWARLPGVLEVYVIDNHPRGQGTVDVIIRSSAGTPTNDLIQAVQDNIDANKPINDDALVVAPNEVPCDISGEILVKPHYANAVDDILQTAVNRMYDLFRISVDNSLSIGEDLPVQRLVAEVMKDMRVKQVTFFTPISRIDIDTYSVATAGNINLSVAIAMEL